MRHLVLGTALLLALTACGSGDDNVDESSETVTVTESDAPAETSAAPKEELTPLVEVCPEVEAALPSSGFPYPREWTKFVDRLVELGQNADTEADNAINLLIPPAGELSTDPSGSDLLDARSQLRTALDTVAERCAAVGSSALQ